MSLDFTAIDFETANPKRASACAVGLARVRDGEIVDLTGTLIQPPAQYGEFSGFNTKVHGITAAMVANAPTWRRVAAWIGGYVGDDLLVAHNAGFDMSVLRQACAAERLPVPGNDYLCTLALARRACQLASYRLPDVAAEFGVRLTAHHEASADANCAAQVAVAMARRHGHDKLEQLAQSLDVAVGHLAKLAFPDVSVAW
ncbi:MAG TPA: 3'-5' exonuclease [Trebonia sp.]